MSGRVVHCQREAYDVYIGRGDDPRTGRPVRVGKPLLAPAQPCSRRDRGRLATRGDPPLPDLAVGADPLRPDLLGEARRPAWQKPRVLVRSRSLSRRSSCGCCGMGMAQAPHSATLRSGMIRMSRLLLEGGRFPRLTVAPAVQVSTPEGVPLAFGSVTPDRSAARAGLVNQPPSRRSRPCRD
jgi:hypothetical protein